MIRFRPTLPLAWLFLLLFAVFGLPASAEEILAPVIEGPWIPITGNPDLGELTSEKQQPVDFGVWQAADGTWQLWSCIRKTKCGGHTRLFYRWEGDDLTQPNWRPMGIAMTADPSLGETEGGMQAPHVVKENGKYHMFYGGWSVICHATSEDGKKFARVIQPDGTTVLFREGKPDVSRARDIMMIKIGDLWYGYYTSHVNGQGADYVRTTPDFKTWSESTVVAMGGRTGTTNYTAECPQVVKRGDRFYLSRTQTYKPPQSTIFSSRDPKMFGINQDRFYYVCTLPVAAPEIVHHDGQDYIFALNEQLDGIRAARLNWKPKSEMGSGEKETGEKSDG